MAIIIIPARGVILRKHRLIALSRILDAIPPPPSNHRLVYSILFYSNPRRSLSVDAARASAQAHAPPSPPVLGRVHADGDRGQAAEL